MTSLRAMCRIDDAPTSPAVLRLFGMDDRERERAADVAGRAVAAMVGASVGGVEGAVAAVTVEPIVSHLAVEAWREFIHLRQRSVGILVERAAARLDVSIEDLLQRAKSSPEGTQLLASAMYQAVQTFNLRKIKALSRAVANGLRDDDARPDEEMLIVSALASLDEAHVKVLLRLPQWRWTGRMTTSRDRRQRARGATLQSLVLDCGLSRESAEHILAELIRTGTAQVNDDGESARNDSLILELQAEVTALQEYVQKMDRRPVATFDVMPRGPVPFGRLDGVDAAPDLGYEITGFGRLCLTYLEDEDLGDT